MRKAKLLLLAAMVAVAGAGCAKGESSSVNTTTTAEVTTAEVTTSQAEETTEEETTEEEKLYSDEIRNISAIDFVGEMHMGWNLGNTFDATASADTPIDASPYIFETAWGAEVTIQEKMDMVLEAGFDVVRIPVTWEGHFAMSDPDHIINEAWMDRIQQVVDMVYKKGGYVILDLHHEDWHYPSEENYETAADILEDVWTQIAERFKDYGDHLIFEGMNEPRKKGASNEWTGDKEAREVINKLEQVFVNTVRATGGNNAERFLMITGYAASSSKNNLEAIQLPTDSAKDRLIVSVHAYIPYNFALNTGNGATANWNNATSDIDSLMKNIKELFLSKGVPVIIGEYGAMNRDNEDERCNWASYYISAAAEIGVPCVWWDNHSFSGSGENFGILQSNGFNIKWKYPNLVEAIRKAAYSE